MHGLLKQSIEQKATSPGVPTIETERELVEVVGQMLVTDRALVCAEDPALQKRNDSMHSRHEFVGELFTSLDVADLVCVIHPTDWMVIFAHVSILHRRERSGYPL